MENLIFSLVVIGACLILSIIIVIHSIKVKDYLCLIVGSIFAIICGGLGMAIISDLILETEIFQTEPTALDVYRGVTELEITSVNGVPKDTVVVFKEIK